MVHIPFHARDNHAHNVHGEVVGGQVENDHVLQPCLSNVAQQMMDVLLERSSGA
jgi:hypothetical protein